MADWALRRISGSEEPVPDKTRDVPDWIAALNMAETLLDEGDKEGADILYERLFYKGREERIQCAGLIGLVRVRRNHSLPLLVHTIRTGTPELAGTAAGLLSRMDGKEAVRAMASSLPTAPEHAGVHIVRALAKRNDPFVRTALRSAVESPMPAVRAAAVACLGEYREPSLKELFGRALKDPDEAVSTASVVALSLLGDPAALPLIRPLRESQYESVRRAALAALPFFAEKLASGGRRAYAIEVLTDVIDFSDDPGAVRDAAVRIRSLGGDVEVPVRKGYIRHFRVIGPFPGREDLLESDPLAADRAIDFTKEVRFKGEAFHWRKLTLDHIHGRLNLLDAVARAEDAGACIYAEIESDAERRVLFKIGSDDDVFCRLNGTLVHAFTGGRGWSADQDSVGVTLKPGVNTVLMKVLNGRGGWDVSLRITDREGRPLDFKGREF